MDRPLSKSRRFARFRPLARRVPCLISEGRERQDVRRDEWATRAQAVVHCAASISFDLPLSVARAINVDCTTRA